MRLLVVVFTILVLVGAAGVAQEKGKDKDKGKKPAEVEAGKDDSMSSEEEVKEVGGKDIDYWLEEIKSKDPSRQETAMKAVMAFGPRKAQRAVPLIITELKKHKGTNIVDVSVRASGILALGVILPAVPKSIENDKVALKAHKEHIRETIKIVKDACYPDKEGQVVVRKCAAQALARLAPEALTRLERDAKGDLPDYGLAGIIAVCKDKAWEARLAGLQTLAVVVIAFQDYQEARFKAGEVKAKGAPPKTVMALYYDHIKNENCVQVRMLSVQALAQIKIDPDEGLNEKIERKAQLDNLEYAAKNDSEISIRAMAHLARITVRKSIEKDDLEPLVWMIMGSVDGKGKKSGKYPEETVRILGAQSISMIGKDAIGDKAAKLKFGNDPDPIRTALVANFDHDDIGVVANSMGAFARIYESASLNELLARLEDPKKKIKPAVRLEAAKAIALAGKTPAGLDKHLLFVARSDPDFNVVATCIAAIGQLYEGEAVSYFKELLKETDPTLRAEAARAIAAVGDRARDAAATAKAKRGDEKVKDEAKKLQERLEKGLAGVSASLTARFKDEDTGVAAACMNAVARVEEAAVAVPVLTPCLAHSDPRLRMEAARSIAMMGQKASLVPAASLALQQTVLKDPDPSVVSAAIVALASIKAYESQDMLTKVSEDTKRPLSIRQTARDALDVFANLKKIDDLKKDKK